MFVHGSTRSHLLDYWEDFTRNGTAGTAGVLIFVFVLSVTYDRTYHGRLRYIMYPTQIKKKSSRAKQLGATTRFI